LHRSSGSDPDVQHGGEHWIRTKWNSVQKYRDGLVKYGLERILFRLSRSRHRDVFILKGARSIPQCP
jgi:hypothetical protein